MKKQTEKLIKIDEAGDYVWYKYRCVSVTQDKTISSGWYGRWHTNNMGAGLWKELKAMIDKRIDERQER